MLRLILTATAFMAAGSAMASSIEIISGSRASNNSIATIGCETCPPLKIDERKQIYDIPVIDEGYQKVEIRDSGDQKQIIRTEKWSGGSPVIRVSIAKTWMPDETGTIVAVRPATEAIGDGIDRTATTAAVVSEAKGSPVTATVSHASTVNGAETAPAPQDFSDFALRTN